MFFILCFILKTGCVFCISNTSQFRLATFQVLISPMWLVVLTLYSTDLKTELLQVL